MDEGGLLMKRMIGWALLMTLCVGCVSGVAETATPTDFDWLLPQNAAVISLSGPVTTSGSMIAVACPAEGAVRLRITGPDGSLFYDTTGFSVNGRFTSEAIYLPLQNGNTVYTVTLTSDLGTRTATVTRTQPYLERVRASAGTLPLSAVTGRQSEERILLLRNENSEQCFPLVAGGLYVIGEAVCTISDGWLTVRVELLPEAKVSVAKSRVRVAFTADDIPILPHTDEGVLAGQPGEPIDLQGHDIAVVWVGLTVSFDPALTDSAPKSADPEQVRLWQEMDNGEEPLG